MRTDQMKYLVILVFYVLFSFPGKPAKAFEIEYAKVFDVTGSVKFVGVKGSRWAQIPKNQLLKSGTRIKTGEQSAVQIKLNWDYSGVVKVGSNSYLKLKNEPPNKLYLEKGDLCVIREADTDIIPPADSGLLVVSTKDLQVEIRQGGCIISVTDRGTWVKVFQDKVQVTHMLADRAKTKTWTVHEGYHLLAKSSEAQSTLKRMEYKDYEGWQKWIRSWYERKDKIESERLRKEMSF